MKETAKTNAIRIVILDNHALVRAGLRLIIENQSDLKVVGQAGNLTEAMSLIALTRPNIILIEYDIENGFSFEIFQNIKNSWPLSRLILVTGSNDRQVYLQAVQHGVMGIVSKSQIPAVLIKAVRKVHLGEMWIEHSLIANLISMSFHGPQTTDPDANRIKLISEREREVIHFIGQGLKNKEIASQLCICEATVRHHLTSIFRKLGVSDRLELLVFLHNHQFNFAKNNPLPEKYHNILQETSLVTATTE